MRRLLLSFATAACSFGFVLLSASPASAEPTDDHRVSLCHETASGSHPYVLITIAEAARDAHEGHGDDVHVDLEPGDPGFGLAACPAGVSAAGEEPAGAGDDTPTRPGTTPPPLGAGIQAVPPTTEQAAPAADVPAPPSIDQNEPVASIPAAPSNTDERVLAAAASALDAAFGESQASVVPAGAVAAGDGSSATDGRGTLPFAVGGAALAAAAGAAFAARRSSRASD